MSLEKLSTILSDADKNGYGVAAFDIVNYETINWVLQVADEERVPVIIMFYPYMDNYIPCSTIAAITKDLAQKVNIPVALHLDHSHSFEQALSGIKYGYSSIMIDGSSLNFEENVKITGNVVGAAHAMGIEVEAELGNVGSGTNLDDFINRNNYTDPLKALEFIERTKADFLAVAIGNGHGDYISAPNLDFDRLHEIDNIINTPLVLHGGSHIPHEQVQKSVGLGINKVNIATELFQTYTKAMEDAVKDACNSAGIISYMENTGASVKEFIRGKLKMLNPQGYRI